MINNKTTTTMFETTKQTTPTTKVSSNMLALAKLALEQRNLVIDDFDVELRLHRGEPSLLIVFKTGEPIPMLLLTTEDLKYDYVTREYWLYVPVGLYLEY